MLKHEIQCFTIFYVIGVYYVSKGVYGLKAEVGKVTLKSNRDKELSNESLLKGNGDEA